MNIIKLIRAIWFDAYINSPFIYVNYNILYPSFKAHPNQENIKTPTPFIIKKDMGVIYKLKKQSKMDVFLALTHHIQQKTLHAII